MQGTHCTGKMTKKISCQEKHREFGNAFSVGTLYMVSRKTLVGCILNLRPDLAIVIEIILILSGWGHEQEAFCG